MVTIIYKGEWYSLTFDNKGELIEVKDREGYKVFNPQLLHNLEQAFNNK